MKLPCVAAFALLVSCSEAPVADVAAPAGDATPDAAAARAPSDTSQNRTIPNQMANPDAWGQERYVGRWTGVEGMYLDVAARPGGGC